ncbi:MAG: nuclease A inhibitor family protein [Microscillaceae bacterium]|nr:nuclease A inhibitor family protein [Microscillaceae bacterium]
MDSSQNLSAEQTALLQKFSQLSEGLLFPSEADNPIEAFFWDLDATDPINADRVLEALGKPKDTPIETEDLIEFFRVVTPAQDYFDEQQQAEAPRFQALMEALLENLEDVTVFRVGEIQIQAYAVGSTRFGGFAGIRTLLIET